MLKDLARKLRRHTRESVDFDPSTLGHPLAMSTEWGPARGGGASFVTHKLVTVDTSRLEFRPSAGAVLFCLIFLIVGLGLVGGSVYLSTVEGYMGSASGPLGLAIPVLVGLVFAVAGGVMLHKGVSPIVFDNRRSGFWRGRVAPHELTNQASHPQHAPFDRIHALQLVSELCRSDNSSFYSYELNLVLAEGTRINVVDHGNVEVLRADAETVARFLDVPLWDAT